MYDVAHDAHNARANTVIHSNQGCVLKRQVVKRERDAHKSSVCSKKMSCAQVNTFAQFWSICQGMQTFSHACMHAHAPTLATQLHIDA